LPDRGKYPAVEILALAGKLWGRTVRVEEERVRETEIEISKEIAGRSASKDELRLLLAAHHVFLFEHADEKEGEILVASRNPEWRPPPPRFTQVLEVKEGNFATIWGMVEREVEARNKKLPAGVEPIVAVKHDRTRKIFLRASRQEDLDGLGKVAEEHDRKDPNRPRYFTYTGRWRRAEELHDAVLEKLTEGERNLLRITVASRGNRLLFRSPPDLGEKVLKRLGELDKRP
jgi:hypothetical protein